ncbi:MAG TPA: hypothetical protein VEU77_02790, partial [Candidatus Acidoferrales bacterium]|nr:hypothetical protein [Candidatus Acidoferrales bacterium]
GRPRLCESCGARVATGPCCPSCGGTRLAPSWVLASRHLGPGLDARITESSPEYGPTRERISLTRWTPTAGARATVNLNTAQELDALVAACRDYAAVLRWPLAAAATPAQRADGVLPSGHVAPAALASLLKRWSVEQVAAVAVEVRRRLDALTLFERVAVDNRTYELRTDASIHRVLEGSLWLIDERYWLLTSNAELRTLIGTKIRARARLRPDFACATGTGDGAIIELKRPRHALTVDDANQVERYLVLAEQHLPRLRWRALLIGGRVSADLRRTARHRPAVEICTFADVIADARHRYRDYLRIVAAVGGPGASAGSQHPGPASPSVRSKVAASLVLTNVR